MKPGLRRRSTHRITTSLAPVLHADPVDVGTRRLRAHCSCCTAKFAPASCPVVHENPCIAPVCGRSPAPTT